MCGQYARSASEYGPSMWHSDQLVSLSRISRVGSTPATPCCARNASNWRTSAARDGTLATQLSKDSALAADSPGGIENAFAAFEAAKGSNRASANAPSRRFIF